MGAVVCGEKVHQATHDRKEMLRIHWVMVGFVRLLSSSESFRLGQHLNTKKGFAHDLRL